MRQSWKTSLADWTVYGVYAAALVLATWRTAALQERFVPPGQGWLAWMGAFAVEGLFLSLTLYLVDGVQDSERQRIFAFAGIVAALVVSGGAQVLESALLAGRALDPGWDVWLRIAIPLTPTICMGLLTAFKLAGALEGRREGHARGSGSRLDVGAAARGIQMPPLTRRGGVVAPEAMESLFSPPPESRTLPGAPGPAQTAQPLAPNGAQEVTKKGGLPPPPFPPGGRGHG